MSVEHVGEAGPIRQFTSEGLASFRLSTSVTKWTSFFRQGPSRVCISCLQELFPHLCSAYHLQFGTAFDHHHDPSTASAELNISSTSHI